MTESRLTTLDASFLEVESPSAHMHVGWSALFRPPADRNAPKFEDLRDHVASRLGRAPRYRQKLAEVPLGVNDPVWVDDPQFDVDRHVRKATGADIGEITDQVMSAQLSRNRPLWELWIADGLSDGRIGVIGKAHHAMADGLAAVELSTILLDPTPQPPPPAREEWDPDPEPDPASLLVSGARDRVSRMAEAARWPLGLARHPGRVTNVFSDGVRAARALADSLRPASGGSELNQPISPRRHLAKARRPLADLKKIKRGAGATINDVVLAAASGGVRRLMQRHGKTPTPLKAMVPVSMRDDRKGGEYGNQISFVFVDLPCDEPDPLRRLMTLKERIGDRKRSGRPEGADLVLGAFTYMPRTLQKALAHLVASPRAFNLVVSNIPGPPDTMYMAGCELEEVYPVVPIADRHALSIGLTTIKDEAFFGIYADSESLPDADLLAGCLDESVEELLSLGNGR
jgi:diacylglycerol O-acyltransferase / wax synthase